MAALFLNALGLYLAAGLAFAVPFVVRGAGRIDPAAAGTGWGFKLLIVPGTAVFWPLLLARWLRAPAQPASGGERGAGSAEQRA